MLKALELIGFKSFADKTRFDFTSGVTIIVGPNGSGKSNVVDAIKWVLGAQSVKALRGKEMADVIFNGSGSRKAINSAEVTMTFDNPDGRLSVDTPEVQITRRIYRSGEGEYFINRQPCRLRDIKELFAGTGIATEAYSVIEQGKVDVMLQSSARDRRIIFEEAAGISRFKAKKLEAERRLARVDQNMLRLSDIVEEVDNRLRTIRAQASRARRYREHTERLQELRTHVAMTDWRTLDSTLTQQQTEVKILTKERDEAVTVLESDEAQLHDLDAKIFSLEEETRETESALSELKRQIAETESSEAHQRSRSDELSEELSICRQSVAAMSLRAGGDLQQTNKCQAELDKTEQEEQTLAEAFSLEEKAFEALSEELAQIQKEAESGRSEHLLAIKTVSNLRNQISIQRSQLSSTTAAKERSQGLLETLTGEIEKVSVYLNEGESKLKFLSTEADGCGQQVKQLRKLLSEKRKQLGDFQKRRAELVGIRTGAIQRAEVLEELERRLEGLGVGVREVLVQARRDPDGPFHEIRGLVADLFHVEVEIAPLVELALGEKAHQVVVASSNEIISALQASQNLLPGRVSFLRLDVEPAASVIDRLDLSKHPGVLGRLDQQVESEAEFLPLIRRLLGRTWLVDRLETAIELSNGAGAGLDFVTTAGERVSADGTLIAGPLQRTTGLISRRSELRALRHDIDQTEQDLISLDLEVDHLEEEIGAFEERQESVSTKHSLLTGELSEYRLKVASLRDRSEQFAHQQESLTHELKSATEQSAIIEKELSICGQELEKNETRVEGLEKHLEYASGKVIELQSKTKSKQHSATERRVALATCRHRLEALRSQIAQIFRDQKERADALTESQERLDKCHAQQVEVDASILKATSRLAIWYLKAEALAFSISEKIQAREAIRKQRTELNTSLQTKRNALRRIEHAFQEKTIKAAHIQEQQEDLQKRLKDEFEIDVENLQAQGEEELTQEFEEIEEEIRDLRDKINKLGAVNLNALEELDELDNRSDSLSAQFEDLKNGKAALEQIIARINADSRKMFIATLETVRVHFIELFRKLFGGGEADIVLDGDEADVLECGIEIVARPPGKDPRSISLLSGGEKTLTCVALLLAIFRSRPSPFCILDEVDAALDEANIERFTNVLHEFLATTQFVVITHSKKTMSHADTLYGITMQESGVSKQVSVRFDDVNEDGSIREERLSKEKKPTPPDGSDSTQAA